MLDTSLNGEELIYSIKEKKEDSDSSGDYGDLLQKINKK